MKRILIALCLIGLCVQAGWCQQKKVESQKTALQNGRFQVVALSYNLAILIDTQTGNTWQNLNCSKPNFSEYSDPASTIEILRSIPSMCWAPMKVGQESNVNYRDK